MDLRKRLEFARMGLELCVSPEQIETDLRRSLFPEMTLEDLNKTIILNAKALIERDADFADFWTPFLGGQGPAPAYVMSLAEDHRDALRDSLRARLPVGADGTIALTARAWAVRGIRKDG